MEGGREEGKGQSAGVPHRTDEREGEEGGKTPCSDSAGAPKGSGREGTRTQFDEKQLSSDPLCKLALLGSSTFFFPLSPFAASRNTEKSIECFGVRIDRQSRSVPILTTCVLFMVFTVEDCLGCSKNKNVPKECFVLCTHSSTNFNFMSLKKRRNFNN